MMLPRLISPQFGLFDDGRSLITSQKIVAGNWDMSIDVFEGRYRPVYWLYFALFYGLFGENPFWFFLGNTLVFAITTYCIIKFVKTINGSNLQAWTSGLFFALAGPTIESYYTLSKGEAVQTAFLCVSLLVITSYARFENHWKRLSVMMAAALAILLSNMAKETTIVVIPISFIWFIASWLRLKQTKDYLGFTTRRAYLGSNIIGSLTFITFRAYFVTKSLTGGAYTGHYVFGLDRFMASAFRWAGWLIRDFSYLVPLVIVLLVVFLLEKRLPQGTLLFETLVWMGVWVASYLPWVFMTEYYMLPFAVGASVFGGVLVYQVIGLLFDFTKRKHVLAAACLGVSIILLFMTLVNNISNAQIQLAVDAANSELINYLAQNIPPQSIAWVNIQDPNEYYYTMGWYISDVKHRPDITLDVFKLQPIPLEYNPNQSHYYIVSPNIMNQPPLVVRLGVQELSQKGWNDALQGYMGNNWKIVYATEHHFRLLNIDLPRLFCPFMRFLNYCSSPVPSIDRRIFSYGWKVYNLTTP